MQASITFQYIPKANLTQYQNTPVVQCMAFCKKLDQYCIVRDGNEIFYSLPGGGCEPGETSSECIVREIQEEAQMSVCNLVLLGSVIVTHHMGFEIIETVRHDRYICDVQSETSFIPNKNGFEVEEKKYVPLSDLQHLVKLLQNPSGDTLIKQISQYF